MTHPINDTASRDSQEKLARKIERIIHENSPTIAMNRIMNLIERHTERNRYEDIEWGMYHANEIKSGSFTDGKYDVIVNQLTRNTKEEE